jgi:nucleoside-diphosphate-sugar epimerase
MELLVLGGTVFLGRAVAEEGVRRGHAVTCACRGESGSVPEGARHVAWDRAAEAGPPAELAGTRPDAVADVARHPSWVRGAVAAFPDAHWPFVSTINVYADNATPAGTPATLPLHEPVHTDEDPSTSPELYGAMKVACEDAVRGGAAAAFVVRPGLIVGPGDPTGRFSFWPARLADAERPDHAEVLAPGHPDDAVQWIDVRDLAAWIVDAAERRTTGTFDGTGAPTTRADFLAGTAAGVGVEPTWVWVPQDAMVAHGVEPWAGPRSLPLWLPLPEYAGLMAHDATPADDPGLVTPPRAETARDTLAWLRGHPDAHVTGLTREQEAEVLSAWSRQARPT